MSSVLVGGSGPSAAILLRGVSNLFLNNLNFKQQQLQQLQSSAFLSTLSNKNKSLVTNEVEGGILMTMLGGIRQRHSKRVNVKVQRLVEGGVHYDGFSYFPRDPENFQDPPIEPSKLFMVKRIRSTKKCPWWEKERIKALKLEARGNVAIVKNTPKNNARLYEIKHLIEITPISVPYGMPDEPKNGFLKENGEFISYNSLQVGTVEQLQLEEAQEKVEELKKKSVDGSTLKSRLRNTYYERWN